MSERETNLKDKLYNEILESIFTNEYRPNQILHEKELIERFHCSKSPVRDALIALCNDNVLRSIPRYGYEVLRLTREDVEDMLRTRYLIEGTILCMAFDTITPQHIDRLEEIDRECAANADDVSLHWESNTKFHMLLISREKNHYIEEVLLLTMRRLKRAYAQIYWENVDDILLLNDTAHHQEIINALRAHDFRGTLLALKEDIRCFGDYRCELPEYFKHRL